MHDDASLREMLEMTKEEGVEEGILKVARSLKKAGMSDSEIAAHTSIVFRKNLKPYRKRLISN